VQYCMLLLTDPDFIAKMAKIADNKKTVPLTPIVPPMMMRPEVMEKMGRLDPEQMYNVTDDNLVLIGSAEHSIGAMHMNDIVPLEDLPLRSVGYSTAFRRESGSYGKDVRGILRVHQFDKIEMISFSSAEQGMKEQDLFVAIQEYIVQQLRIPYQVVANATGDMGSPDYRQMDIECWMPGQNKYRETHSADYNTDYQARRLKARYTDANGKKHFLHMNDATAIAVGRMLIAIMENYQRADGSIGIPKVLQLLVGKSEISSQE